MPGQDNNLVFPSLIKEQFEKIGIDKEMPSIHKMICWVDIITTERKIESVTFEYFMELVQTFYGQKYTETGARNIFQLF